MTVLAGLLRGTMALVASAFVYAGILIARIRPTLPTAAQIAAFRPAEATRILSSDGVLLAALRIQNRKVVPLDAIAPDLVRATIAVEDSRFYGHHGYDVRGILRAGWADLWHRDLTAQGGSTITQQLARNVSQFGVTREKSLARKLREVLTAARIESVFDKGQILELYLNQIYYGSGAYGVEAAAQTYFGKPASRLSLPEAALLAGLPQRPAAFSPYADLPAAIRRRNVVLRRMLDTGAIARRQYDAALTAPVHLAGLHPTRSVYRAPYFVDWVVQGLVARYGVDNLYSGWTVVTTLDWRMQREAERAVRRGLSYGATQGALVSLDPHTGEVRAMVGGVDYRRDRFNAITQGKLQPGSAFKAVVYAAAFDSGGLSLQDTLPDGPLSYAQDHRPTWVVHDFDGYSMHERSVLDAITYSINTIAVQAADQVGTPTIIQYARRMGITTDLTPYLSLALGASAVRPIELCSAYGLFAAGGDRYEPTGVLSVRDSAGRVVLQDDPGSRRNASSLYTTTIDQMNLALRQVVLHGTGAAAAAVPDAFGKTGTTSDHRDAWFVGYTPNLATAVWVAHPARSGSRLRYAVMPGATGGRAAAPIWARFMMRADAIQQKTNRARYRGPYRIVLPPLPEEPKEKPDKTAQQERPDDGRGAFAAADATTDAPQPSSGADGWTDDGDAWSGSALTRVVSAPSDVAAASRRPAAVRVAATVPVRVGRQPAAGPMVTVRVCADSGELATPWCDTTALIRVPAEQAPTVRCTLHQAPSGER